VVVFFSHFGEGRKGLITVLPTVAKDRDSFHDFYKSTMEMLGATFCFGKLNDSFALFLEKASRADMVLGRGDLWYYSFNNRLGIIDTPSTSEMTKI